MMVSRLRIAFFLFVSALFLFGTASVSAYVEVNITSANGTGNWTIPDGVTQIDVLVVGGGGGAGQGATNTDENAGGGGAGGLIFIENYSVSDYGDSISFSVGSGGAGSTSQNSQASDGTDTVFGNLTAVGGGGGGSAAVTSGGRPGRSGGSGGGGGLYENSIGTGGTSTQPTTNDGIANSGFGNAGADSVAGTTDNGGGGGGAGGAASGATGGVGLEYWGTTYAIGGSAGSDGSAGAANTGSGGNARPKNSGLSGGSGADGIIRIRYTLPVREIGNITVVSSLGEFNNYYRGSLTFNASLTNFANATCERTSNGGSTWSGVGVTESTTEVSYTDTPVGSPTLNVSFRCRENDEGDYITTEYVEVLTDNTAPSVSYDPTSQSLNASFNVEASVSDAGSGVNSSAINYCIIDGAASCSPDTSGSSLFNITITPEGTYTACVYTEDNLGNNQTVCSDEGAYIFTNPPIITDYDSDPSNSSEDLVAGVGLYFFVTTYDPEGDAIVGVSFFVEDPTGRAYLVGESAGELDFSVGENETWRSNAFTLPNYFSGNTEEESLDSLGEWSWNATVTSNTTGFNQTTVFGVFTVEDTSAPGIEVPNSPTESTTYVISNTGAIPLDIDVNEGISIDSCWFIIDSVRTDIVDCGQDRFDTNFTVSSSGNYSLQIFANDSSGNEGSITISNLEIIIDEQAPTISFDPVSASNNTSFNVSVSISDSGIGLNDSTIQYCLSSTGNCTPDTSGSASFDVQIDVEGTYTLCVYAEDNLSNAQTSCSDEDAYAYDATPPTIGFDPSSSSSNQQISVVVNITDAVIGVNKSSYLYCTSTDGTCTPDTALSSPDESNFNVWTDLSATDTGNWVSTSNVDVVRVLNDTSVYTGIASGKFGVYNPSTGVWTDLSTTDPGNWGSTASLNSMDAYNTTAVYTGATVGKFGVYNPATNVWTDLSATDSGNWFGTNSISALDAYNQTAVYTGGIGGKFGVYNPVTNVWTDLSSTDAADWVGTSAVYGIDAYNDTAVYTVLQNGKFGVYNPSTGVWTDLSSTDTSNWVSTLNVLGLDAYNSTAVYTTIASGRFGAYNPATNVWTDLTSVDTGNWFSNANLQEVRAYNDTAVFIVGDSGRFGVYNPATNTATSLISTATGGWISFSSVYSLDVSDSQVYTAAQSGKLGVYGIPISASPTIVVSTEGANTICVFAEDNLGNDATTCSGEGAYYFDETNPVISFDPTSFSDNRAFNVSVSVSDSGIGLNDSTIQYCLSSTGDCTPDTSGSASFDVQIDADGNYTLCVYAEDNLSNSATTCSDTDAYELALPTLGTVTATELTPVLFNGYASGGVNWSAPIRNFDNITCERSIDGGVIWTSAAVFTSSTYVTTSISVFNENTYNVSFRCREDDAAFLTTNFVQVIGDDTPPVVSFDPESLDAEAPFNVTVNISDARAGVNASAVEYCLSSSGTCTPDTPSGTSDFDVEINVEGRYTLCVYAEDNVANNATTCSVEEAYNYTTTTVENLSITPELNVTYFGGYVLSANVTNTSALDNVTVTYSAENTFGNCDDYLADGTCRNETYTRAMSYNDTSMLWEYTVYPDAIYPEVYFVNSATSWANAPQDTLIDQDRYHLFNFTNPFEFTNETSFFIEIGVEPRSLTQSVPLDVYLINNSVTDPSFFETDWRSDPRVVLVESISRDTPIHHVHTENSSHYLIRLSTDAEGLISGLNLTGNLYMAFYVDTNNVNRAWNLKYYDTSLCTTDRWLTADSRPSWTAPVVESIGCPDTHFHITRIDESGGDFVNVTVSANEGGTSTTSTTQFYFGELPNLPPNPSSFINPVADGYVSRLLNSTYTVSWNEATDPNNDPLSYTLRLFKGGVLNDTLVENTTSLEYDWTIPSSIVDGEYLFVLQVCDDSSPCCACTNNTVNFTLDSTNPILSGPVLPSVSKDDTGTFTILLSESNPNTLTVEWKDPEGTVIGPFNMTLSSGTTYSYSYRFTVVGDYNNATFRASDLAGNSVVLDAGGFEITNAPPTQAGGGGGGGGGGTVDEEPFSDGSVEEPVVSPEAEGLALVEADPEELVLTFYNQKGRIRITNLGGAEETYTIRALNDRLAETIRFSGSKLGLAKIPGTDGEGLNAQWVEYEVFGEELADGRYPVFFQVSDSQGRIVGVAKVDIVKRQTLTDEVLDRLTETAIPPLNLGFFETSAITYLAIVASVGVAGIGVLAFRTLPVFRGPIKPKGPVRGRREDLEP